VSGLTTSLTVLLIIAAIISFVGLALTASAIGDVQSIRDGDGLLSTAEDANGKVSGGTVLWGLLAIPILVLLIIWTHRAHSNLKAFGVADTTLPSGMAIGSWFIPLFWFLGPYWCIADANRGAAEGASTDPEWRRNNGSTALLLWWIAFCVAYLLFVAGSIAASANSDFSSSTTEAFEIVSDPDRYITGWTIVVAGYAVAGMSAILGALGIRAAGARQEDRIRDVAGRH